MFLAEAALAPSTLKAYRLAWKRWENYLFASVSRLKGDGSDMEYFMLRCYQEGLSKASMSSMIAGISFMAKVRGLADPTKSFLVKKALKGWSRLHPVPRDHRRPIDKVLLSRLIRVLPEVTVDDFEASLFSAAFSMAFHGALRIGELVAQSRNTLGSAILEKNVIFNPDSIQIKIVRSKTDQLGVGHWLTLGRQLDGNICPVRLCYELAVGRPQQVEAWLVHKDSSPVTRFQFHSIMCKALDFLGLPSNEFGTHSFRIGAATVAAADGASSTAIQALGRWKSNSYKRYIRPDV
ncbi:integrase/recombinase xerD homolog [Mixophyes fleayi]|uniref:integrase/recombinase xerD homolog n=1 Tax=Mixophyes fleayi TaxID=3061075 RepID=UPI003F4DCD29